MKKVSAIYIFIAILLSSCDSDVSLTEQDVIIEVAARSAGDDNAGDDAINSFRVLVYKSDTKRLAYSQYVPDVSSGTYPVVLNLKTGEYDFIFIANELSSASASQALSQLSVGGMYSALENISFEESAFDEGKYIPMVTVVESVWVVETNKIKLPGVAGYTTGLWGVELERAGVRIDLTVTMSKEQWELSEKKLYIEKIPENVSLLPGKSQNTTDVVSRELSLLDADVVSGQNVVVHLSRIILPERMFSPAGDGSKGLTFGVPFGDVVKKNTINSADNDYTIPRNTYLKVGLAVQNFEFSWSTTVHDWNEVLLQHEI